MKTKRSEMHLFHIQTKQIFFLRNNLNVPEFFEYEKGNNLLKKHFFLNIIFLSTAVTCFQIRYF